MKKTPLKRKKIIRRSKVPFSRKKRATRQIEGKEEKKKEVLLSKLKQKLDSIFSRYIRAKYPKRCYTCGRTAVTLQNGHYISRQYLYTRWDERNCRPQCVGCNMFAGGRPFDFEEKLKKELGEDVIEEMKHSRHQIMKVDRLWYEEKIAFYEKEIQKYT